MPSLSKIKPINNSFRGNVTGAFSGKRIADQKISDLINNYNRLNKYNANFNNTLSSLSTSLPSIENASHFQEEKINNIIKKSSAVCNELYPSTPPPSPTLSTNRSALLNRFESTSGLIQNTSSMLKDEIICSYNDVDEDDDQEKCEVCRNINKPLVNINLSLIDVLHHQYISRYKKINKLIRVSFFFKFK
jgi:hypothetical protein